MSPHNGGDKPPTVGEGAPMTVQIPASRHDELAIRLATRIEQRLAGLGDELEHAGVVVYDADRGLATRGGVIRMSIADIAAVVAEVVLRGSADG
jgi:type IV pilus biogenesis protein CpaD/CtpE